MFIRLVAVVAVALPPIPTQPAAAQPAVHLSVRYSRFSQAVVRVPVGWTVRFDVANRDPIDHELIIGDDAAQLRHERSSDVLHHGVDGEVSVAPRSVATTVYRFDRPGRLVFACHLPGHFAYGMRGVIVVEGRQ